MCQIGSIAEGPGPRLMFQPCLTPECLGCSLIASAWEHLYRSVALATAELSESQSRSTGVGGGSTSETARRSRIG